MTKEALPNVVIVLARCTSSRKPYGLRFEEKARGHWSATWAFAIKESSAVREGCGAAEIRGAFEIDQKFPGCPHCRAGSMFRCGCGKVACHDGMASRVTCPWCSMSGDLDGSVDSLNAGADR